MIFSISTIYPTLLLTPDNINKTSKEIEIIEKENNASFLSAYIKEIDNDYPSFNISSYFYKLQSLSRRYTSKTYQSNNVFMQYLSDTFTIYDNEGIAIESELYSSIFDNVDKSFKFKLLYGNFIESNYNEWPFKYGYISSSLAEKFNINQNNIGNVSIPINTQFKNSSATYVGTYNMKIMGVIDDNTLGVYKNYIGSENYIFANYSDQQLEGINCGHLHILFGKEQIENESYLRTLELFTRDNVFYKLYFSDVIGQEKGEILNNRLYAIYTSSNPLKLCVLDIILLVISISIACSIIVFISIPKIKKNDCLINAIKWGPLTYISSSLIWLIIIKYLFSFTNLVLNNRFALFYAVFLLVFCLFMHLMYKFFYKPNNHVKESFDFNEDSVN